MILEEAEDPLSGSRVNLKSLTTNTVRAEKGPFAQPLRCTFEKTTVCDIEANTRAIMVTNYHA